MHRGTTGDTCCIGNQRGVWLDFHRYRKVPTVCFSNKNISSHCRHIAGPDMFVFSRNCKYKLKFGPEGNFRKTIQSKTIRQVTRTKATSRQVPYLETFNEKDFFSATNVLDDSRFKNIKFNHNIWTTKKHCNEIWTCITRTNESVEKLNTLSALIEASGQNNPLHQTVN